MTTILVISLVYISEAYFWVHTPGGFEESIKKGSIIYKILDVSEYANLFMVYINAKAFMVYGFAAVYLHPKEVFL